MSEGFEIDAKITNVRGILSLQSPAQFDNVDTDVIDRVPAEFQFQARQRDGNGPRHCSLVNPAEGKDTMRRLQNILAQFPAPSPPVLVLGLGLSKTSFFLVIACPQIQLARAQCGLGWKDLHVTLGFDKKDSHEPEASKGVGSLLNNNNNNASNKKVSDGFFESVLDTLILHWQLLSPFDHMKRDLCKFSLDLIAFAIANCTNSIQTARLLNHRAMINFSLRKFLESYDDAREAIGLDPESIEAVARIAEASFKCNDFSICLQACWKLYTSNNDRNVADKIKAHSWEMLKRLWRKSVVNLEIVDDGISRNSLSYSLSLNEFETNVYKSARFNLVENGVNVEERHTIAKPKVQLQNMHRLPRRFSWIIPLLLAGMSTPKSADDIIALRAFGITKIITLTEEEPLPREWFEGTGITNFFWPVTNYYPASIAHADKLNQLLLQHILEKKGSILVHCGGGIGRAGSLLATFLVRYGLNVPPPICSRCETRMPIFCDDTECALGVTPQLQAKDAIDLLRAIRPNSIETQKQEHFVSNFVSELFRRAGLQSRIFSPLDHQDLAGGEIKCDGQRTPSPNVIVLCGLPGSGKSWFTETLLRESSKWVSVSQDDLGSKSACENLASTLSKRLDSGTCVVIDRCNPTVEERGEWLKLLGLPKNCVLVHFDADKNTCIARAEYRLSHPTVKGASAKSVVSSYVAQFQKPKKSTEHSGFQAVYTVSTFNDSVSLLAHFGIKVDTGEIPVGFVKYPRTRHLFDLGAASRDDLILDDMDIFLATTNTTVNNTTSIGNTAIPLKRLTIEEKIDGANVGFRLDPSDPSKIITQNRTHTVTSTSHVQFSGLGSWVFRNQEALRSILAGGGGCILFGEWMVARHSVPYDMLPDYFVAFDIYDLREGRFYSRARFDEALDDSGIAKIARIEIDGTGAGALTKDALLKMIQERSAFSSSERREGLVLRIDDGLWLDSKAKIVRPDFISGNEHWSKGIIEKNKVGSYI
ncbi:hypothetical protein HK100_007899 [Physocladia obscura]|uniref:Tyrosine specific protein phosphatases domain-containing protein n=1 Tax=Physocladia obscura TaxID=109957 RepID=A0AAD5XBU7_9FUNG|nr:hypothetical protein HK100_007899 [Physocladia obscura]